MFQDGFCVVGNSVVRARSLALWLNFSMISDCRGAQFFGGPGHRRGTIESMADIFGFREFPEVSKPEAASLAVNAISLKHGDV